MSLTSIHKTCVSGLFLIAAHVLLPPAVASTPAVPSHESVPSINLTISHVGILDDPVHPEGYGLEYRFAALGDWRLSPVVGITTTESGNLFVYADLRRDFWLNDRFLLVPSFGVGRFDPSRELDLGDLVEFRTGIELAWRFHEQYRVGLALFHFSNGGISARNPGTETVVLTLSVPL